MVSVRLASTRALIPFLLATCLEAERLEQTPMYKVSGGSLAELSSVVDAELKGNDVACYCKAVDSMSECIDNKYSSDPHKPSGPRFFHPDANHGQSSGNHSPHLCCKLDWTSLFSWVGFGYKRQDTDDICKSESREVPPDSCCRLKDEHGSFGVRVSKAKSDGVRSTNNIYFYKAAPEFSLEDITGGEDHTGMEVAAEDVQEFVRGQLESGKRFNGKLECGGSEGSFQKLFADKETCQLRSGASQQCCCHVASLIEAIRCLPAEGAPDDSRVQQQVLESSYKEQSSHGKRAGHLTDASWPPSDLEGSMQVQILGTADPKQEDLPETAANETSMLWDWVKSPNQWTKECVEHKSVPYVITRHKSKRVRNGQTCRMVRMGKMSHRRCSPKYKTKRWTEHSQGSSSKCSKWQWRRLCGAGAGLYFKEVKPGQCMKEPDVATEELALTEVGGLLFECPDDYSSGNGGTEAYNPKCVCQHSRQCK